MDGMDIFRIFQGLKADTDKRWDNNDIATLNDFIQNKIPADYNAPMPKIYNGEIAMKFQPLIGAAVSKAQGIEAAPELSRFAAEAALPGMQSPSAQRFLATQRGLPDRMEGNPVAQQMLDTQAKGQSSYADLGDFYAGNQDPMLKARLGLDPNVLKNQSAIGEIRQTGTDIAKSSNDSALGKFTQGLSVIDTSREYGTGQPGTFMPDLTKTVNQFYSEFAKDPKNQYALNDAAKLKDDYLKSQESRQTGKPFAEVKDFITSGPARENLKYMVDANGVPIATTKAAVTYTPPVTEGKGRNYRPMPSSTEKRLTSSAELTDSIQRFETGFLREYAGKTVVGELSNTTGKIFGDKTGQAQWWQDYQGYVNDVRQEKFGASLTNNEKNEFLKYIVTPRMAPEEVAKNLTRQKAITQTALARVARGYATQYDPQTIEEFIGRPLPSSEETRPPNVTYGSPGKKPLSAY